MSEKLYLVSLDGEEVGDVRAFDVAEAFDLAVEKYRISDVPQHSPSNLSIMNADDPDDVLFGVLFRQTRKEFEDDKTCDDAKEKELGE